MANSSSHETIFQDISKARDLKLFHMDWLTFTQPVTTSLYGRYPSSSNSEANASELLEYGSLYR